MESRHLFRLTVLAGVLGSHCVFQLNALGADNVDDLAFFNCVVEFVWIVADCD